MKWFGHADQTEVVKIFSGFEIRIKSRLGRRPVIPLFLSEAIDMSVNGYMLILMVAVLLK